MGRRNLSAKAIRDIAPVLIPLMTKVVVPMAMRNMQRSKSEDMSASRSLRAPLSFASRVACCAVFMAPTYSCKVSAYPGTPGPVGLTFLVTSTSLPGDAD